MLGGPGSIPGRARLLRSNYQWSSLAINARVKSRPKSDYWFSLSREWPLNYHTSSWLLRELVVKRNSLLTGSSTVEYSFAISNHGKFDLYWGVDNYRNGTGVFWGQYSWRYSKTKNRTYVLVCLTNVAIYKHPPFRSWKAKDWRSFWFSFFLF